MLENKEYKRQGKETKKRWKEERRGLERALEALQQPLKEAGIPVMLVFEGWSAAGKGAVIARTIARLDPRNYQVLTFGQATDEERRRPMLWPFWKGLPAKGQLAVLERSWFGRALERMEENPSDTAQLVEEINTFERQLCDDGYLILKFFLHIGQDEQRRRLEKLAGDDDTAWRVTDRDWRQNRDYVRRKEKLDLLLQATNTPHAPWHVVWNEEKGSGAVSVLRIVKEAIADALDHGVAKPAPAEPQTWPLVSMPRLDQVDLSPRLSEDDYNEALKKEKKHLAKLHSRLYREKVPVVIGFEGWDAAGKGGAIRRLSWALDPRGFDVVPIAAPTKDELDRHYLWRFWRQLPKDGHIVLFDRTWYGRVMVERLEGLTPEARWSMAYDEINEFERSLVRWGAVVLKFWLHIDPDEQLRRFQDRENTPEKRYKITDEDWRNREKWPDYEVAVDEMLQKTSTEYAPWVIVEGNDKKYARLKVLRTVRKALEERLDR